MDGRWTVSQDSGVKSAVRAFEILELFERRRRPLALADIVADLGYPVSSASALLKSLLGMGYLDYDRARRLYFPTMRVAVLGRWVEEALFGDAQLIAAMEDLHRETGEAVILAIQSDLHALYAHIIYSDEPLQFRARPGLRRPLARSGLGWALLSRKSDTEIEQLRRRINAQTENPISREELMGHIDEARKLGYAFSKHAVSEGVGVIATPLPKTRLGKVFALAVAGYVSRLERHEKEYAAALQATVARLSDETRAP
jgi:DNA-binding IclR family transcriptional regulator